MKLNPLTEETSPNVTDPEANETDPGWRKDPWLDPPDAWPWDVSDEIDVTDDRPILCAMAAAFSAAEPFPWSDFNSCAVCRRMSCAWALSKEKKSGAFISKFNKVNKLSCPRIKTFWTLPSPPGAMDAHSIYGSNPKARFQSKFGRWVYGDSKYFTKLFQTALNQGWLAA